MLTHIATLQVSDDLRKALDLALRQLDQAKNAYDRGAALAELLGVVGALVSTKASARQSVLRSKPGLPDGKRGGRARTDAAKAKPGQKAAGNERPDSDFDPTVPTKKVEAREPKPKDDSNSRKDATRNSGESAYETAKNGGKHHGHYLNYINRPTKELERSVKSLEKQVKLHEDKISNPDKHYPHFKRLPPQQQEALLTRIWPGDIARQKELIQILEGIINERK